MLLTIHSPPQFSALMDEREKRDLAWLGDAVLGLYARQWLLNEPEAPPFNRQERFVRFTSNAFLSAFGEPTEVEARIGAIYQQTGLESAFNFIESELLPIYKVHLNKAARSLRGNKGRKSDRSKSR